MRRNCRCSEFSYISLLLTSSADFSPFFAERIFLYEKFICPEIASLAGCRHYFLISIRSGARTNERTMKK
jgi:hypothetical protein